MSHRQIILDTETTGLSPDQGDRVIEIGALEMINRRLTGKRWHSYLHPDRAISPGAVRVHGITLEFLADKPRFIEVAEELQAFLHGAELIIHNASFDMGFLDYEFSLIGRATLSSCCSVLDTLPMARQKHPGQKNSLDALCKRYGIDNTHRTLHGALLDAEILAEVYLAMTGGQESLSLSLGQEAALTTHQQAVAIKAAQSEVATPVLLANEEELAAHLEYLNKMQKGGKVPLWLQDSVIPGEKLP
ncbi:MAG: DNA polymerase III subunit epsilon [Gammaproteobacteria bacterium]